MEKKINVLGIEYTVETKTEQEDNLLEGRFGYNDRSIKKIVVDDLTRENVNRPIANLEYDMRNTFRHELFHALFHEAGLTQYEQDEVLIEALARLAPRIKQYL